MYAIRPTQALLRKLSIDVKGAEPPAATTALGDWFLRAYNFERKRFLLCTSSRSLFTVLVPARDLASVAERVRAAVGELLYALGAPADQIRNELDEMDTYVFRSSNDRRVIGSMTDMARMADAYLQHGSSLEHLVVVAMKLARAPCGPLEFESPQRVALRLLRRTA